LLPSMRSFSVPLSWGLDREAAIRWRFASESTARLRSLGFALTSRRNEIHQCDLDL
jgi:hypothetical protein